MYLKFILSNISALTFFPHISLVRVAIQLSGVPACVQPIN